MSNKQPCREPQPPDCFRSNSDLKMVLSWMDAPGACTLPKGSVFAVSYVFFRCAKRLFCEDFGYGWTGSANLHPDKPSWDLPIHPSTARCKIPISTTQSRSLQCLQTTFVETCTPKTTSWRRSPASCCARNGALGVTFGASLPKRLALRCNGPRKGHPQARGGPVFQAGPGQDGSMPVMCRSTKSASATCTTDSTAARPIFQPSAVTSLMRTRESGPSRMQPPHDI